MVGIACSKDAENGKAGQRLYSSQPQLLEPRGQRGDLSKCDDGEVWANLNVCQMNKFHEVEEAGGGSDAHSTQLGAFISEPVC